MFYMIYMINVNDEIKWNGYYNMDEWTQNKTEQGFDFGIIIIWLFYIAY